MFLRKGRRGLPSEIGKAKGDIFVSARITCKRGQSIGWKREIWGTRGGGSTKELQKKA